MEKRGGGGGGVKRGKFQNILCLPQDRVKTVCAPFSMVKTSSYQVYATSKLCVPPPLQQG